MKPKVKVVAIQGRRHLAMRWTDPVTGAPRQRTAKTSNRRKAERKAADLERELRSGAFDGDTIPFSDFRDRYWDECLPALARRTRDAARTAFNHYQRLMKPRTLDDVTPATLATFAARLRSDTKRVKRGQEFVDEPNPKCESSIASYLRQLHAALVWAESIRLIPMAPRIRAPKRAKGKHSFARGRAITSEEFERMLAMAPVVRPHDAPTWTRYLNGLWLSGLRLEESTVLSWEADAPISVDLTGKRPRLKIHAEAEKGNKDRYLPVTPDFAAFLDETPEHERQGPVFFIESPVTGEQMTPKRIGRVFSEIGRRAGVVVNKAEGKFASAHDLRRSFGTRWSMRVKPAVLQLLMRHKSIETTMKYYVTHDADEVSESLWQEWGSDAEQQQA